MPMASAASGTLVHTKISFDKVFDSVCAVFQPQMGQMAVFGLVIFGINIGLQIIGQGGQFAAQTTREPAILIGFMAFNTLLGMFVQTWITVGSAIYMLKVARGQTASINDLGSAGPYIIRLILLQITIGLVSFLIAAVCLAPAGILYFATREEVVGIIAAVVGVVIAMIPLVYLVYSWFIAMYFIVDRDSGVIESLSQSSTYMAGNKLIAFLILLVVGVAGGFFAIVTCCFGYILVIPYMSLATAAIYLSATGQPWGSSVPSRMA
jgi:hypothetical protein